MTVKVTTAVEEGRQPGLHALASTLATELDGALSIRPQCAGQLRQVLSDLYAHEWITVESYRATLEQVRDRLAETIEATKGTQEPGPASIAIQASGQLRLTLATLADLPAASAQSARARWRERVKKAG